MRATTKEQGFYSQIFKLVLPIVIQNLLSAAVNSADVVMLNYVGQSAISAVSLASNYANVLFMVYYGLGTGATLLCAQYFGKGNMRAIQTVEGIALRFSVIISVVVAGIAFTMPQMMMRLFTDNAELIRIGASYLRVMGVTYLCWGITEIYLAVLRSLGRVTISMAMNMMAFALNVFFNACFIFGLFGFPKLGATGVAIATAMSRVIELIGCVIVSIMSKDIKLDLRYMFIRNKMLFSDFVKLSLPALGNDLSWGVAFSMYSVILGHLGSDAVAANSLVVVVRNIGTVLCFGVASAGGILLGNVMGEGNLEKAKEYAKLMTDALGGYGIFGVEMFVKGDDVLFSEVSPRPHDTGMVTMISQNLSEFALHARAILGIPIANIRLLSPAASRAVVVEGDTQMLEYGNIDKVLARPDTDMRIFSKPCVAGGHRRMAVLLARADSIEQADKITAEMLADLKIKAF